MAEKYEDMEASNKIVSRRWDFKIRQNKDREHSKKDK